MNNHQLTLNCVQTKRECYVGRKIERHSLVDIEHRENQWAMWAFLRQGTTTLTNPILIQSVLIWWRVLASLSLTKFAVVVPCRKNAHSIHWFSWCSVSTKEWRSISLSNAVYFTVSQQLTLPVKHNLRFYFFHFESMFEIMVYR